MKKGVLILLLAVVFLGGVGFGITSARALWSIAYMTGSMHSHAELVLDTQYFKESVEGRKPFTMGDYTFVPSRSQAKTVRVHRSEKPKPMGGKE